MQLRLQVLLFYEQDFSAWEQILRELWSITDHSEGDWIGDWLDSVGALLPSQILTTASPSSDDIREIQDLYTRFGTKMILVSTLMESAYTMVCEWSPGTVAHAPNALHFIDEAEEMMKKYGVPLPAKEAVRFLASQKDFSLGKPFEGLRLSKGYKDFEKTLELTGVLQRIGVKTQEEFKRDAKRVFEQYQKYREAHPGSTSPKPEGNCVICPDCQGKGLLLKKLPLLKVDAGKVCKTCSGSGYVPIYKRDFIEIPADNIIKESKTENPNYCDKQYIVYISPGDSYKKIRVNTYYLPQGEKVRICTHYDRGLCDTVEKYDKLPIEYIEEQAYGSWMDGAR